MNHLEQERTERFNNLRWKDIKVAKKYYDKEWDELHELELRYPDLSFYEDTVLSWDDVYFIKMNRLLSDPAFEEILQSVFLEKVHDLKYSIIKNEKTGEYFFPMVPFRGNPAHSKKKYKRIDPIIEAYGNKEFSKPLKGSRSTERCWANAILITFTHARSYSKEEYTKQGFPIKKKTAYAAWQSTTEDVNQFKVELSRVIEKEHKRLGLDSGKVNYVSCLVKEGTKDGYPAPHLVVIFDKPVLAHRYGKKWLLGGSPNNRSLVDSIQAIWERIAGSHCKINAIVTTGGFSYVFKYIMKSIDLKVQDPKNMTKEQRTCLNTHMYQSLHNQHDIIGKKFLEKLEYEKEENLLDITSNELKQITRKLHRLESQICEKGGFFKPNGSYNPFTFFEYPDLNEYWGVKKEYDRLREEVHRLKMETSPWFYVSGGFSSVESAMNSLGLVIEEEVV